MGERRSVKRTIFRSLIFLSFLLTACSDGRQPVKQTVEKEHRRSALTKPPSFYNNTIEISHPSAVFYCPDSLQLKNIKAIIDSSVFESVTHDCFYQMRNARHVLKEYYPDIEILEISKARYLLFKYPSGDERIDLNDKNDPCGLFLYDGRQRPRLVDMTNIDTELRFYFSK